GFFWIGGPGEEAFNTCLGLQVKKGEGPAYDYLNLHYRNSATLVAMGMPLIDGIRQMAMTATDTHSMGRNFSGHFAKRDWNVLPITSVIEVRHLMAPGTALVQKRHGGHGITIVCGGDAGSAEGDFASCMIWSTLPGKEVPVLIIVENNGWGISTPACSVHGDHNIYDPGKAFCIPGPVGHRHDPVASRPAIRGVSPLGVRAGPRRPQGHRSARVAAGVKDDPDPIPMCEETLLAPGAKAAHGGEHAPAEAEGEFGAALDKVLSEQAPGPADIER